MWNRCAAAVAAISVWSGVAAAAPVSLDATLEPYLARYGMPALAAAVVNDGVVVAAGAVGTRRVGIKTPVTINDRFHLGSDTKAMTALLVAMLVEEGKLRWGTTVGEIFPELQAKMAPGLSGVTLTQLLSHTSGVSPDNQASEDLINQSAAQEGNLDEMRYWLVSQSLPQPLVSKPGTTFAYANMNYVIAGAILERVSGRTWDELITERVFAPLQLTTAGLGNQASLGRLDAPLGHAEVDGKTKAYLSGPNGDNPAIIGPAGIAYMSVLDFGRWAGWNAAQGSRGPQLVKPETMIKLHTPVIFMPPRPDAPAGTPPSGGYGLGWGQLTVDWAPQPLLFHGGSNGKNVAHIWVEPSRDVAMVLMTNIGGKRAEEGLKVLASALYGTFAAAHTPGTVPTEVPTPVRAAKQPPEPGLREFLGFATPGAKQPVFSGDTRRGLGQ
ncbi:MAG: serine hydrolase domain-containing protein [bacterium]